MTTLTITFVILIGSVLLFLSGKVRPDLVALFIAITLGITGVLTPQEVFSGFSRSAIVTIMAIYVLAEGLQRTGVTEKLGSLLLRLEGVKDRWLMVIVMLSGAFLSLFMNNIAAAAVLLPAVSAGARRLKVNPSRLLMPLAFGTILGGMATLLTTTNILVSSVLRDHGLAGFGLLDFLPLGLPIVAVGVAYMASVGWNRLPSHAGARSLQQVEAQEVGLPGIYRLGERLVLARVPAGSPLIGKSLAQSDLRQLYRLNLLAIENSPKKLFSPAPEVHFKQGDVLLMEGRPEEISQGLLNRVLELLPLDDDRERQLESWRDILVEAVLTPRSGLIGQTVRSAHFREKYDLNVIAIWRSGKPIRTNLSDLPLQFGDALLLQGKRERVKVLRSEPDLIILNGDEGHASPRAKLAWPAALIMGAALVFSTLNIVPLAEAMLAAALLMVLLGILSMDRAYQVIDWKTIFLIAGIFPLSIALAKTGAADRIAEWMVALTGPANPVALLAGLVLLTVLLSQVMNGAAVAAVVAPIAIVSAEQIGADPRAMAMGVALASSLTFLTPLGHPVNMLVMGPGAYRFRDFLRAGLPLTVLLLVLIITLLPVFWPLT